jgi:hypothetical protein
LLLREVGAAHVADSDFLAQVREHLDHLGGADLGGKGSVWACSVGALAVRGNLLRARG